MNADANMPALFNRVPDVFRGYEFLEGRFEVDEPAFVENHTFANLFSNYVWFTETTRRSGEGLLTSIAQLDSLLGG